MWPFRKKKQSVVVRVGFEPRDSFTHDPVMAEFNRSRRRTKPILDRHFATMEKMEQAYYRREVDGLDPAIKLCNELIAMAPEVIAAFKLDHQENSNFLRKSEFNNLREHASKEFQAPTNPGFKQLAIVRERQKEYGEVIRLCRQAADQGWSGDWDVRIARCQKKLANERRT